jgi:hypothetical protein
MDHRAGGKIRIGFTANQPTQVAVLAQIPGISGGDRYTPFASQPSRSLAALNTMSRTFNQKLGSSPNVASVMATKQLDIQGNQVRVGTADVGVVQGFIQATFGATSGFDIYFNPDKPVLKKTFIEEGARTRGLDDDRLFAGDWIRQGMEDGGCTLGFGAWQAAGVAPTGKPIIADYGLTAGHCYPIGATLKRGAHKIQNGEKVEALTGPIGTVERRSLLISQAGHATDAEAIRLVGPGLVPRWIHWSEGVQIKVNGVGEWTPGMTLCHSGAYGGSHCGPTDPAPREEYGYSTAGPIWLIRVHSLAVPGDSGSGIFDPRTSKAVALLSGGPNAYKGPTDVTPLLSLENKPYAAEVEAGAAPGALNAPGMNSPNPLQITDGFR